MNTIAPAARTFEGFVRRFRDTTTRRILILHPSTDWPARWKADSDLYAPTQITCMRGCPDPLHNPFRPPQQALGVESVDQ